jgi:hypothetical protein
MVLGLEKYQIGAYLVEPVSQEVLAQIQGGKSPANRRGQIDWPEISCCEFSGDAASGEIEPGESEELHCDLLIPATASVVQLHGYLCNSTKWQTEIGWNCFRYLRLSGKCLEVLSYEPKDSAKAAATTPTAATASEGTA